MAIRARFTIGIIALASLLGAGLIIYGKPPPDPTVNGKPMSVWVSALTTRWTGEHGQYGYPRGVRAALLEAPEAAIPQLLAAVRNRPGRLDRRRLALAKHLPPSVAKFVRPERPRCRWAGVMALSRLAMKHHDPRIGRAFAECMRDPDPLVRKVTAFELRPWIFPDRPALAAALLRQAIEDPVAHVRRDACRCIVLMQLYDAPEYAREVALLRSNVETLAGHDPDAEVREHAGEALRVIDRAAPARPVRS